MTYKGVDLPLLNDLAWHIQQVKHITNRLTENGVSDTDIEGFLKEYKTTEKDKP